MADHATATEREAIAPIVIGWFDDLRCPATDPNPGGKYRCVYPAGHGHGHAYFPCWTDRLVGPPRPEDDDT